MRALHVHFGIECRVPDLMLKTSRAYRVLKFP